MRLRFAIAFALTQLGMPALGYAGENEAQFFVPIPKGWVVAFDGTAEDGRTIEFVPDGQTIHNWSDMIAVYVIDRRAMDTASLYFAHTMLSWGKSCRDYGYAILGEAVEIEPGPPMPDPSLPSAWFLTYCTWSDHRYTELQDPAPYGQISTYYAITSAKYLFVAQRSWRSAPLEGPDLPMSDEVLDFENARMAASVLCENEANASDCADLAAEQLKSFTESGDTIFQVAGGLTL
jgi:hypothetical protein